MSSLPSGIVAFLLTDVESSTVAWNESPEDMDDAVGRLDTTLTSIVEAHHGAVVKARGEGDSHFAVFSEASRAVAAAAALQRREDHRLAVRASLSVGEAEPRGGDYLGAIVNHGARIRSVAHGGQTIATRAAVEVACARLPADLSFRALGVHRVADIPDPIELFQLLGPGLRATFPPLRTESFSRSPVMAVVSVDEVRSARRFELPDEEVQAWQRDLIRSLRDLADAHDGRFLKLLGDGCLVAFEDPRIARHFADDVMARGTFRIGIALGLVDVVEGELTGRTVFDAYRLRRLAAPGEVRCCEVTGAVCQMARSTPSQ